MYYLFPSECGRFFLCVIVFCYPAPVLIIGYAHDLLFLNEFPFQMTHESESLTGHAAQILSLSMPSVATDFYYKPCRVPENTEITIPLPEHSQTVPI